MKKSPLPQSPPGFPATLATSVGDLLFLRTENGEIIPHPTEEDPIRIGFVGDRPDFTSMEYYIGKNNFILDSEPLEFDSDGMCVAPEIANGCFRRDGDDMLMVSNDTVGRVWPKNGFDILAIGKSDRLKSVTQILPVRVKQMAKTEDHVAGVKPVTARYYFASFVLTGQNGYAYGEGLYSIGQPTDGLNAIRKCILDGSPQWAKNVSILNLRPLSGTEYNFLKGPDQDDV